MEKQERRIAMPTTGEKPGKGTYKCVRCGQTVTLDDDTDTLPPCPNCDGTEFVKISGLANNPLHVRGVCLVPRR
jgi:DNA-directed RNA polymerase subunit RPC12/RpoP